MTNWLRQQRREHKQAKVGLLQLPGVDPPRGVVAELVDELCANDDRSVTPVQVLWMSESKRSSLSMLAGLLTLRDAYRPTERRQRKILRQDRSRARVVAGEPAKVGDLRRQWQDTTVGDDPRDFARFVLRRAALAIEQVELRLLGPEYRSPKLCSPRCGCSVIGWPRCR